MGDTVIQITNLPEKMKDEFVQAAFLPFGDCIIEIPREKFKHKGYALVQYEDEDDADHAVFNMNNSEFFGNIIRVTRTKKKLRPQGNSKVDSSKPFWKDEEEKEMNYEEKEEPKNVLEFKDEGV
ncbi:unnamed protein product [Moneuplotes crassus]|uniref:RRM domain-containing protein n=2 Tax=Euplotes crassus TaxID=5936 RepID=A0AAD1XYB1_EUPCR|nr:unnamed protein product [Moneuplotes crassus]